MSSPGSIESMKGTAYWAAAWRATARSWPEMLERRGAAKNLSAGLTIALVAIPLNLALAIACGLPPEVGLVTGAIAGVVGALLGGARLQVTGPEVALAPIGLEIVLRHGVDGLIVTTFLAGLIQIAFGVLRIGRLIHAIPVPVVGGFMAAVGLLVFDAQLPRLLGLPAEVRLMSDIRDVGVLGSMDPMALALGLVVIVLFVGLPRVSRSIPAPLVAVTVAIVAALAFSLSLPTVQPITGALPLPGLPSFAGLDLRSLFAEALALAMLASIDSLLCAVSVEARTAGERTRTDQELVAQGLANMASASFGGMPVAAAVVRSMAAVESGATTRLAPLSQSLILGAVLIVLAPFVAYVPLVALAGVLLVVGARLIELRAFASLWRMARFEAAVFGVTALGILLFDFVLGVGIGVVAALVHFAREHRTEVERIGGGAATTVDAGARGHAGPVATGTRITHIAPGTCGLRLEGPLFFGSQAGIAEAIRHTLHGDHLVIDVSGVSMVDISGAMALAKVIRRVARGGASVSIYSGGRTLQPALRFILDECRAEGLAVVECGDLDFDKENARRPPGRSPEPRTRSEAEIVYPRA